MMMTIQDDVFLIVQPVEPIPYDSAYGTSLIYHSEGGGSIQKELGMMGIERLVNPRKVAWLWGLKLVIRQLSDRLSWSSDCG
jgi:hypothetical protein